MIVTDDTKATAQAVLDYIAEHPEQHEQANFIGLPGAMLAVDVVEHGLSDDNFCNTTMCIAGTVLFLNKGVRGIVEFFDTYNNDIAVTIEEYAGDALGLDYYEQYRLFYCMDNATAIDAVRAIAAGDEDKFYEVLF